MNYFIMSKTKIIKSLNFKGKNYKVNFYLAEDPFDTILLFRIVEMLLIEDHLYFVLEKIDVLGFDDHFAGFRVGRDSGTFQLRSIHNFAYPPFELHATNHGLSKIFKLKKF
jgi:hypothetical protein